jgi:hypothetical protein
MDNSVDFMGAPAATRKAFAFEAVIDDICRMPWERLYNDEVLQVAQGYYYFSIQFRENLEIACQLFPADNQLRQLYHEECHTDNLSPWPGITECGEKINHDEFINRLLSLQPVNHARRVAQAGHTYLSRVRKIDRFTRATSIASYEDEGLSRVFAAILRAPDWRGEGQLAFKYFLEEHIKFDSDKDQGHGTLSRGLAPDDRILPLWMEFTRILITAVPKLSSHAPRAASLTCDLNSKSKKGEGARCAAKP